MDVGSPGVRVCAHVRKRGPYGLVGKGMVSARRRGRTVMRLDKAGYRYFGALG